MTENFSAQNKNSNNADKPSMVINDKKYLLTRLLGEGYTALVYLAETSEGTPAQLAVKILKPGLSEHGKMSFKLEREVLSELNSIGAGQIVPRLEAWSETEGSQFIAMQYVDPLQWISLDKQLRNFGPVSWQDAFKIAENVLKLLHKMHTDVENCGRTYTDMQLQNFYVQRTDSERGFDPNTILIIDWNHVSPRKIRIDERIPDVMEELKRLGVESFEQLVLQDLSRFAAYLYYLIVGKQAREQGETAYELESRAPEMWQSLPLGVRNILLRGVHVNPGKRYQTAEDFLTALRDFSVLFETSEEDLQMEYTQAEKQISDKDTPWDLKVRLLDRARVILNVLKMRDDEDAHIVAQSLENLLIDQFGNIPGRWVEGKFYYDSGVGYRQAAEIWEPEARERASLDIWHWVLAARVGIEMTAEKFEPIRPLVDQLVRQLQENADWGEAKLLAVEIRNQAEKISPSLESLISEVGIFGLIQEARSLEASTRSSDWETGYQKYEQAIRLIKNCRTQGGEDYANTLIVSRGWGDLEKNQQVLKNRMDATTHSDESYNRLETSFRQGSTSGLEALRLALWIHPGNPGALKFIDHHLEILWREKKYTELRDILQVLHDLADTKSIKNYQEMEDYCQAEALSTAILGLIDQENWQEAKRLASDLDVRNRSSREYTELIKTLSGLFEKAILSVDLVKANRLDNLLNILGKVAPGRQEKLEQLKNQAEKESVELAQQEADLQQRVEEQKSILGGIEEINRLKTWFFDANTAIYQQEIMANDHPSVEKLIGLIEDKLKELVEQFVLLQDSEDYRSIYETLDKKKKATQAFQSQLEQDVKRLQVYSEALQLFTRAFGSLDRNVILEVNTFFDSNKKTLESLRNSKIPLETQMFDEISAKVLKLREIQKAKVLDTITRVRTLLNEIAVRIPELVRIQKEFSQKGNEPGWREKTLQKLTPTLIDKIQEARLHLDEAIAVTKNILGYIPQSLHDLDEELSAREDTLVNFFDRMKKDFSMPLPESLTPLLNRRKDFGGPSGRGAGSYSRSEKNKPSKVLNWLKILTGVVAFLFIGLLVSNLLIWIKLAGPKPTPTLPPVTETTGTPTYTTTPTLTLTSSPTTTMTQVHTPTITEIATQTLTPIPSPSLTPIASSTPIANLVANVGDSGSYLVLWKGPANLPENQICVLRENDPVSLYGKYTVGSYVYFFVLVDTTLAQERKCTENNTGVWGWMVSNNFSNFYGTPVPDITLTPSP